MALAEIFISCLLRRLAWLAQVEVIAYVDDINFLADSPEELNKAIDCLYQFAHDFYLMVSSDKSCLWGSDHEALQVIGHTWGLRVSDKLDSMGMEWLLESGVKPDYVKESLRIQEVKERLARMQHLPASIAVKAATISTGCLSPLDYSPHPDYRAIYPRKLAVKRALGNAFAALSFSSTASPVPLLILNADGLCLH